MDYNNLSVYLSDQQHVYIILYIIGMIYTLPAVGFEHMSANPIGCLCNALCGGMLFAFIGGFIISLAPGEIQIFAIGFVAFACLLHFYYSWKRYKTGVPPPDYEPIVDIRING